MVPFLVPLTLCDFNNSANVSPHFDYPVKTNALVTVLMLILAPVTSCDQKVMFISFQSS